MAKYIIDVPNNGYVSKEDGCLYIPLMSDGCDPLMVNPTWLLTGYHAEPYIETDRKAIENEVWENTWKMFLIPEDFGATMGDSYSEAKAKYDAWKKEKEDETIKQKVIDLANDIGIHKLYSMVVDIRGE